MPRGRPTRLTQEVAEAIEDAVRLCGHIAPAAQQIGILGAMACEWVERGEGRHPTRPKTKLYANFAERIRRAQGETVLRRIKRIEKSAEGGTIIAKRTMTKPTRAIGPDGYPIMETITEERYQEPQWNADTWFLERFDPERWGRRLVQVEGDVGGDKHLHLHFDLKNLTDEELTQLKALVGKARLTLPAMQGSDNGANSPGSLPPADA